MPPLTTPHGLPALRARLAHARGPQYWRALEDIATEPGFRQHVDELFPQLAQLEPALDRRGFLRLLGASLALAGLGACSGPPPEQIVPWVRQPEGMPQSLAQFYATTLRRGGDVAGVLVETHQGRPTKIEGNPAHPASLGGSDALGQAAVLELWDPDRSQAPMRRGVEASWDAFAAQVMTIRRRFDRDGAGLHVLGGRIDSPTLAAQRAQLLRRYPGAQWHVYEAIDDDNALQGARVAFGAPVRLRHHFDRAAVIVSLEADFLAGMPGHLRYAHDFMQRRRADAARATPRESAMSRLYAIEATPSLTGARADHAWPLASARIEAFVRELAVALGLGAAGTPGAASGIAPRRVQALADDLAAHRGASLLLAGPSQPPAVHALVHALNGALGNGGHSVEYFDSPEPLESSQDALHTLLAAMQADAVDTLLVLDGNPAYATPRALGFAELLARVPRSIHLGLYHDETARCCSWHLPRAHALEAWSDLRAFDGTASIVQPVIAPLYRGRSSHEVLAQLLGATVSDGLGIVRATWRDRLDDAAWQRSLREGVIAGSAPPARALAAITRPVAAPADAAVARDEDLELVFRADPTVWDGRYANSGWLQELPKPLTRITWSNAALISPALAARHGLRNGDTVRLAAGAEHVEAPVWIMPGQAERSVTLALGYGRRRAGHVGDGLGFDAYALRSAASPWRVDRATLRPDGNHVELAVTQHHHSMQGRAPVRAATLAQFVADPRFAQPDQPAPPSLYPQRRGSEHHAGEYAWGMSIDLAACIGCNACTVACQAENNIPVVGAEEVARGREMHWIRVDRYYEGDPAAPRTCHQPVPCMHCEHAPCEVVCPVGATVHDSEGLNLQIYNRCVGTRFCSNNCPYKVRRFNFLQYADLETESLKAQRNPDVTVRNRGVMEKCTYCIQRIETAHIAADRENRRIADGEIVSACQGACPTRAITFGNIADPDSAVSREKASPRNYALLEELNTRPRTTYLAGLRNPNPALGEDP